MSENKKLIPKRRFKEFQNADAWEECELGEVVFVNSGRDYKHLSVGNIPVYGTGGYMLSVNNKLSDEDAVGIGRKGSIDNPQYLRAPFWTVDTLFFLTPKEEMNLRFFYAMAQGIKWRQFDESTGVPSLSKVNIEKITKNFPKIEEQEIIGQFFKNLDQTIAFQQRKLEKMKSMKSAYLSEMFPAEGERKPKRRFPGFTDDWEQRELLSTIKSIVDFRGRTPKKLGMDWSDSGYLALSALNVKNGYIDFNEDVHYGNQELYDKWMSGKELYKGQVLFTTEAPMGNVVQVPDDKGYILSQRTIAFNINKDLLTDSFLYVLLGSPKVFKDLSALSSGGTAKGVSQKSLEQLKVCIPKDIDEQSKISEFFINLDQTIAFQQQKLEKLQNIKKAYLNEMFI